MTLKPLISFVVAFAAVVCCGCGCIKPQPADDVMSVDTAVSDSLIDSSELDAVGRDMPLDGAGDSGPDDICGPVDADPIHVVGQPCEVEGESYCIEEGSYVDYIPSFSWQCVRPGVVECSINPPTGTMVWQNLDCKKMLRAKVGTCLHESVPVFCVQGAHQSKCCPLLARTYAAGTGVLCAEEEIGKSRCGVGNFHKGGSLSTCNLIYTAAEIFPASTIPTEVSSDKCDYVYMSCPYWYTSESCPSLEFCHHPTACESGTNEYGEPTNICAGACIYDTDQGVARCAKTCDDLFNYYLN